MRGERCGLETTLAHQIGKWLHTASKAGDADKGSATQI